MPRRPRAPARVDRTRSARPWAARRAGGRGIRRRRFPAGHVPDLQSRHDAPQFRERSVLEVRAARVFGSQVRFDVERRANLFECGFVRFRKRVGAAFGRVPARGDKRARDHRGGCQRGQAGRVVGAAPDGDAEPHPDGRERQPCQQKCRGDQHDVEPNQAVLKLRHHRGWRVAGRALPHATANSGNKVDDPCPDGDAEREDGGR